MMTKTVFEVLWATESGIEHLTIVTVDHDENAPLIDVIHAAHERVSLTEPHYNTAIKCTPLLGCLADRLDSLKVSPQKADKGI